MVVSHRFWLRSTKADASVGNEAYKGSQKTQEGTDYRNI